MRISKIGGRAKFVKKAVAPASLKGSFLLKSLNAALSRKKNNVVLLIRLNSIPLFIALKPESNKKRGHPYHECPPRF
jgi:hypothetical protein